MSLVCPVGPEGNLLADPDKQHCKRLNVRNPVLTLNEMQTLKSKVYVDKDGKKAFSSHVIDCTFPAGSGPDGMLQVSCYENAIRLYFIFDDVREAKNSYTKTFPRRRLRESVTKLPMRFKEGLVKAAPKRSFCQIAWPVPIACPSHR